MKFHSKVDLLIIGPLMALIFYFLVMSLMQGHMMASIIVAMALLLVIHILLTTTYTIIGEQLHIRSSFIRKADIDIADIISLQETNDTKSAPANSMDRIRIIAKNQTILVAPKRKHDFIDALTKINADIKLLPKEN